MVGSEDHFCSTDRREAAALSSEPRLSTVRIVTGKTAAVDQRSWDRFAQACAGSYLSGFLALIGTKARLFGRATLYLLDVHLTEASDEKKIGQIAVFRQGTEFRINDRLLLLPAYDGLWEPVMTSVLRHLGAGNYRYGAEWSTERPRECQIKNIAGVTVKTVRPLLTQAIDFTPFSDWESYWRTVRHSVRYEAKRAAARGVQTTSHILTVAHIYRLVHLRVACYRRKRVPIAPMRWMLRYAWTSLSSASGTIAAFATDGRQTLASTFARRFGSNIYYLDAGSRHQTAGGSWLLLRELTRDAFASAPDGKFVMGTVDFALHNEASAGGLLQARRALRTTNFATSIVMFSFAG